MMKGDDHRLREGEGGSGWRYSNEAIFSTISSFGFLVLLCSNCPYFRIMCVLSRVLICCCCSCAPFRWWLTSFGSGIGEVNFETGCSLSLLHPLLHGLLRALVVPLANISYHLYPYHHHIVVAPYLSPSTSYTQPQSVLLFLSSFLTISFPDLESEPTLTFMAPTLSLFFCFVYFPPKQTTHSSDRLKHHYSWLIFFVQSLITRMVCFSWSSFLVLCP